MTSGRPKSDLALVILATIGAGSAACSDATSPTVESVAGEYDATVLVIQDTDLLVRGGHLYLSLSPDSAVSGELFVPEGLGGPISVDMAGTFRVRDGSVTFSQPNITFLSLVPLRWSDGAMAVSWEEGENTGTVRMERR